MEDNLPQACKKWLENLSKIRKDRLEALATEGIKVVKAQKGFFRCNFVVSDQLSDGDGNWHVGAMATLTDLVGATTAYAYAGPMKSSVDFSISYYSTVKEEVEIEAKVVGDQHRLTSVVIEVKRKGNGELIALGKLWMASFNDKSPASRL